MTQSSRKNSAPPAGLELGEFVRGLAHDIANPLNAMAMNAELTRVLLDRGDAMAAREALDRLLSDTARCGRLVQSFQRFGATLQDGERDRAAVGALLQAAISQMQDELPDTGIEFVLGGVIDAQVDVDAPAFVRALAGVLRNAAEAAATTVTIDVGTADGNVRIEIADNGSGIEARWRERVIEPFFTTRRPQGASGLGLTLAQEIVRRHGGTLAVRAGDAHGTTVTVELPRA
jgi:signal transduction histidine kinase